MGGGKVGPLMNILLVEDEEKIADFIKEVLEGQNFKVTVRESVEEVLEKGYEDQYDLVILDLMLGGKPGEYFLQQLRKARSNLPVLVLSALGQISKKIELLHLGADDYLTKPFDAQELVARIHALYRRCIEAQTTDQKKYGDLIFSRKENKIVRGKKEEFLTKKEGDVLELLIQHRGRAVRIEDILMKVWQAKRGYHSNIVQATIRRLRKKVDTGFSHKLIRNIHGVGYMIALPGKKD